MKYTKGRELTWQEAAKRCIDADGSVGAIDRDGGEWRFYKGYFAVLANGEWVDWYAIQAYAPYFEALPVNEVDEFAEVDAWCHAHEGHLQFKRFARILMALCDKRYARKEDPK